MLGPNYGKWWNEQPKYARLRYGLVILPVIILLSWMLYQYSTGAHLRDEIFDAVERCAIKDIRALILEGASADVRQNNGTSLLHHAIDMGCLEVIPLLIKEGADVDAVDHRGLTPMHLAAGEGNNKIVELLIQSNADPAVDSEQYGAHAVTLGSVQRLVRHC